MARLRAMPVRLARPPGKLAAPAKVAEGFYRSAAWLALVARRKLDPDYAAAKARGKPGERMMLDHIVERRDGGADLDPANTQWLTHSEHNSKTARARARRAGQR